MIFYYCLLYLFPWKLNLLFLIRYFILYSICRHQFISMMVTIILVLFHDLYPHLHREYQYDVVYVGEFLNHLIFIIILYCLVNQVMVLNVSLYLSFISRILLFLMKLEHYLGILITSISNFKYHLLISFPYKAISHRACSSTKILLWKNQTIY